MSLPNNGEHDLSFNGQFSPKSKPLLDLISVDMDFEQAYSMYSTLQQQSALQSVEQLEQAQLQRDLVSVNRAGSQRSIPLVSDEQCHDQPVLTFPIEANSLHNNFSARGIPAPFPPQEYANAREMLDFGFDRFQIASGPRRDSKDCQVADQFFSNTELDALERFLDTLDTPIATQRNPYHHEAPDQWATYECLSMPHDLYTNKGSGPLQELVSVNSPMQTFDEVASKMTNTRYTSKDYLHLTADKYLGQLLTNPNSGDMRSHDLKLSRGSRPNQISTTSQDQTSTPSSMKPSLKPSLALHPASSTLSSSLSDQCQQNYDGRDAHEALTQLLTPHGTTQHRWNSKRLADGGTLLLISPPLSDTALGQCTDAATDQREFYSPQEECERFSNSSDSRLGKIDNTATSQMEMLAIDVAAGRPRGSRRQSKKQLLSVQQRRLNHSFSEQKRRLLCKMAYDRCLRLVINIDLFQSIASRLVGSMSYRRKDLAGYNHPAMDKDGMPKLSKHNALTRISNEIMLLKHMNESLMKILYGPRTSEESSLGMGKEKNPAAT